MSPDFDLRKLANRLSISSMYSDTSSNGSKEADSGVLSFPALAGLQSLSSSSRGSSAQFEPSEPGLATPKNEARYSRSTEYDEGQTPTFNRGTPIAFRTSSQHQEKPHISKALSDPLGLHQFAPHHNTDNEWVEAYDAHANLEAPFMQTAQSRSSEVSTSSSHNSSSSRPRLSSRSKTIGSSNPHSHRNSARLSIGSSPILAYLNEDEPKRKSIAFDETSQASVLRSPSLSSNKTFSRQGSLREKAPSLTRKHSRSLSRSTGGLSLPQLVRKLSDATPTNGKKRRKAVALEVGELFDVLHQHQEKAKNLHTRKPLIVDVRPLPEFINKGRLVGSMYVYHPRFLLVRLTDSSQQLQLSISFDEEIQTGQSGQLHLGELHHYRTRQSDFPRCHSRDSRRIR